MQESCALFKFGSFGHLHLSDSFCHSTLHLYVQHFSFETSAKKPECSDSETAFILVWIRNLMSVLPLVLAIEKPTTPFTLHCFFLVCFQFCCNDLKVSCKCPSSCSCSVSIKALLVGKKKRKRNLFSPPALFMSKLKVFYSNHVILFLCYRLFGCFSPFTPSASDGSSAWCQWRLCIHARIVIDRSVFVSVATLEIYYMHLIILIRTYHLCCRVQ